MNLLRFLIFKVRLHITITVVTSFLPLLFLAGDHKKVVIGMFLFACSNIAFHLYNAARDMKADAINNKEVALSSIAAKRWFTILSILLVIIMVAGATIYLPHYPYIYGIAAMVFIYNGYGAFSIKKMFWLKNAYMGLFYGYSLTVFSYVLQPDFKTENAFWNGFFIFLLTISMEALWDIKDMNGDRENGVKTIANTYGITVTKVYAMLVIVIAMLLGYPINIGFLLTFFVYILLLNTRSSLWVYHLPIIAVTVIGLVFYIGRMLK